MAAINRQSILKAFYRFDQKHIPLTNIEGSPVTDPRDVGSRQELCQLWLEAFDGLDNATWDKVIEAVQNECKEYPSIDKLYGIIERLTTPAETQPMPVQEQASEPPPPQPVPEKKKQPKKISMQIKIERMLELAKQGNYLEARHLVEGAAVPAAKIIEYAKTHWPDCTDEWIAANQHELVELVRCDDICYNCFSLRECPTQGYCSYGRIDKYHGGLSIMTARCKKNRRDDAK